MSAVSVLWTILSIFLLGTCGLAIFSPFWFEHIPDPLSAEENTANSTFVAFGLLRYCSKQPFESLQEISEWSGSKFCSFYKDVFTGIPSPFWKVSVLLYMLAILLLFIALLLAHISCCRKMVCGRSVFAVAGFFQLIAGM